MAKQSANKTNAKKKERLRRRYGIGEWYGQIFNELPIELRSKFAQLQFIPKKERETLLCPFRAANRACTKEGGVCSLRLYELNSEQKTGVPASGDSGQLVTTCPIRFQEGGIVYSWVGKTLLGTDTPAIVPEVGFLEREGKTLPEEQEISSEDVGRIDCVLVHPSAGPLAWCALEVQSVYFSGQSMKREFQQLRDWTSRDVPFPAAHRRPDFRSSGPKRLMPQLQVKVPTLRRWGKKMAVIIDRPFFDALGRMEQVKDVSNCDIAWFVVRYQVDGARAVLVPDFVALTTLERSVEGLTGGFPVPLQVFEKRVSDKLLAIGGHPKPI